MSSVSVGRHLDAADASARETVLGSGVGIVGRVWSGTQMVRIERATPLAFLMTGWPGMA